ncbi:MAG: TolC family protein [Acidiferrobacter sp.]
MRTDRPTTIPHPLVVMAYILVSMIILQTASRAAVQPLTLRVAQRLALQRNPGLKALTQQIMALRHKAIAITQLPDPHLSVGTQNLPLNSFALNQQQMTVLQFGVSQSFPPFGKLGFEGHQLRIEAQAAADNRQGQSAELILLLREAWLNAVYDEKAIATVAAQQRLADESIRATLAQYRSTRASADDVLRAQLARGDLANDINRLQAARAAALAQIAQILVMSSLPPLDRQWPSLRTPASLPTLQARLRKQPLLRAAHARFRAAEIGVRVARSEDWPTITVAADYGKDFFPGSPNWLSVGVNISLPIFRKDRQDQGIDAAQATMQQTQYRYDDRRLDLERQLRVALARYTAFRTEYRRTDKQLLPTARMAFSTVLARYAAGRSSLTVVLRAEKQVLGYALAALQYRKYMTTTAARIDFLTTEEKGVKHDHP